MCEVPAQAYEVRVRLPRGEGEERCLHGYVRFLGEEATQPETLTGKDDQGRRWIWVPTLTVEGQPEPGFIVSVAEQVCPASEGGRARRSRMAGLQRSGACIVAAAISQDGAESLLTRELCDLEGEENTVEEVRKLIRGQWQDFVSDWSGQIASGLPPPTERRRAVRLPRLPAPAAAVSHDGVARWRHLSATPQATCIRAPWHTPSSPCDST